MKKACNQKKLKIQQIALWCLCWLLSATALSAQVTLPNQSKVNNFPSSTTHINGSLNIGGSSVMSNITNLSPLSNIQSIGGDLNITFNGSLSSVSGLSSLRSVGGRIFITNNPNLSECTGLLGLVSAREVVINDNANGCNSINDINKEFNKCGGPGNNQDSDGDGILDCADGCPFNPNKVVNDACGCETNASGDSDGDGSLDCDDECPFDRFKTKPGQCGCGNTETPDSDGDGVADCNDGCPFNRFATEGGICGCETPSIIDVRMSNRSVCNAQSTNDNSDDTYQATVTVTFAYPPKLGAIRIKGASNLRFDFANENESQTVFAFNMTFPADGKKVDLLVEYIGNETCNFRYQKATNLAACSDLVCDVPQNIATEVEGDQVKLTWDYVADWMSYEYRYRQLGRTEWIYQWTDQNEIVICDLAMNQHYEYEIRSYCGTDRKSAYASGMFTAGTSETDCLPSGASSNCIIQNLEIVNIQKCYDRGTAYESDDYFYADVMVYFQNPPVAGTLNLMGNTFAEVESANLQNETNYKFQRLKIMENGSRIDLTAAFSTDENCQFNINYAIPSNPCFVGSGGRSGTATAAATATAVNFTISPNPVQAELMISYPFTSIAEKIHLTIFDVQGRAIFQKDLAIDQHQFRVDVSSLTKGMYYVQLNSGAERHIQKLVKL